MAIKTDDKTTPLKDRAASRRASAEIITLARRVPSPVTADAAERGAMIARLYSWLYDCEAGALAAGDAAAHAGAVKLRRIMDCEAESYDVDQLRQIIATLDAMCEGRQMNAAIINLAAERQRRRPDPAAALLERFGLDAAKIEAASLAKIREILSRATPI